MNPVYDGWNTWFVMPVNPDPWAIGPLGVGKKNGKYYPYVGRNVQLASYKEAVRDLMAGVNMLTAGEYSLTFYFWRRLDGSGKNSKHTADATNLQKATEDALQGVLFDNDRDVRHVESWLMQQSEDAPSVVVLRACLFESLPSPVLPPGVVEQWTAATRQAEAPAQNVWPPRG